jgi:predicted cation transporter
MEYIPLAGLVLVLIATLVLPFSVKKIEEELELFLLIMGITSVTISGVWSKDLMIEALKEPLLISATVLVMGFLLKFFRKDIIKLTKNIFKKTKPEIFIFFVVFILGMISSFITAIVAGILLSEIITIMKFNRDYEIRLTVLACLSIGLGAALTPVGEPLSTIVVSKLKAPPHNADFFYMFKEFAVWIIPGVFIVSIISAIGASKQRSVELTLSEDASDTYKDYAVRAAKVYMFVAALVLLGAGINPLMSEFITKLKPEILYWINIISATLDNATLAASEIVPALSERQITFIIMGLLTSGIFLIPGNIPNIICASKLNIKSKEWAKYGIAYGTPVMIIYFIFLYFLA